MPVGQMPVYIIFLDKCVFSQILIGQMPIYTNVAQTNIHLHKCYSDKCLFTIFFGQMPIYTNVVQTNACFHKCYLDKCLSTETCLANACLQKCVWTMPVFKNVLGTNACSHNFLDKHVFAKKINRTNAVRKNVAAPPLSPRPPHFSWTKKMLL
jgi:hypothetical protein